MIGRLILYVRSLTAPEPILVTAEVIAKRRIEGEAKLVKRQSKQIATAIRMLNQDLQTAADKGDVDSVYWFPGTSMSRLSMDVVVKSFRDRGFFVNSKAHDDETTLLNMSAHPHIEVCLPKEKKND